MSEIAPPMEDNEAFRRILATLESILATLRKDYDALEGTNAVTVSAAQPYTRAANENSVNFNVLNKGSVAAQVFEDDKQLAIVPANSRFSSPTRGKKVIKVTVLGGTTSIAFVTWVRNPQT